MRIRLENRLLNGEEHPKAAPVPVEQLVEEYRDWSMANKRPRTVANDQARIRRYLEFAKPGTVADVTTRSVMQFFAYRSLQDSAQPAMIITLTALARPSPAPPP